MSEDGARRPPHRGECILLRVVIPAHDEERVIGKLVADLLSQQYPSDSYRVCVLADRCTDATARVAATAGATVLERTLGPDGKGALLDWYLKDHPVADDEGLVVLDADNRVDEDFLALLSAALVDGVGVVQASVLPSNLDASPIAAAAGLGDWVVREMVYKKAAARGWSVELSGTGFCATGAALSAAGGWSGSLTEDLDLTIRLLLADMPSSYLPNARVWDEKPATLKTAVGQRRRWAQGRTGVRKSRGTKLWKASVTRRSPSMMAMALRLVLARPVFPAADHHGAGGNGRSLGMALSAFMAGMGRPRTLAGGSAAVGALASEGDSFPFALVSAHSHLGPGLGLGSPRPSAGRLVSHSPSRQLLRG